MAVPFYPAKIISVHLFEVYILVNSGKCDSNNSQYDDSL
ncbi:hypothetical protein BN1221_00417c [Brenneria goodwinii]|uniref:Uncharacterized protein n=1 Tax=Brenneria goodwinii TaxID=1109412 RepID=A0A0G4JQ35_9GAMM|nr:hypothetical protein BN1221_00417c [Brenneria goodwinii]